MSLSPQDLPPGPSGPSAPWVPPPPTPVRVGRVVGLVVGAALLTVVLAVAAVLVTVRALRPASLEDVGASAAAAGCDDVVRDEGRGIATHVGPGTDDPDLTRVPYEVVPPSAGPHLAAPVYPAAPRYTESDRPPLEQLVHNLEHGYTILWVDPTLPGSTVDPLEQVSDLARDLPSTRGKFLVVDWDDSYGPLPDGRPYVLTHWTADGGVRQACADLSGEAVAAFVGQFPAADSPEPNAP